MDKSPATEPPDPVQWWVIEDASTDIISSLYWGGRHGWTAEHLKAVRFCREDDAQSQAETMADQVSAGLRVVRCQWHVK